MQEFSSISVSSYEAGSLADQLTEQSRAGWTVVAIVPTGSTVTAYLSRDGESAEAPETTEAPETSSSADATDVETAATPEPVLASTDTTAPAAPADEPAAPDPTAVSPGWAAGLETSTASGTADTADAAGEHFTVADEPAAEPAPEAAPAAMATAGAGAAPAGWYADPSSRFELRYWDGTQWTEHVSRAGQQYTDPPVA